MRMKCQTIKLCNKNKLHKIWKNWIKISIDAYNLSLDKLNEDKNIKKYDLRNYIIESLDNKIKEYNVPNATIQYACFDAIQAFKQGNKTEKRDYKKQTSFSIGIDGRNIRDGYIYKTNTGREIKKNTNDKKHYKDIMEYISMKRLKNVSTKQYCRLVMKKHINEFYLTCPTKIIQNCKHEREVISLDPGVRTFMTFYDGESYGEIGKNIHIRLKRLNKEKDKLDSKISGEKKYYRKTKLKKARARIYKKIGNIVKDLHYKTINFLSRYKLVILPEFKVKEMLPDLNKYVRRSLLDLSHFKFKLRLAEKTSETGTKLLISNEAYTSKTCTSCGKLNYELGNSKTFNCPSCNLKIDRDVNGARNIMLRVLKKEHILLRENMC